MNSIIIFQLEKNLLCGDASCLPYTFSDSIMKTFFSSFISSIENLIQREENDERRSHCAFFKCVFRLSHVDKSINFKQFLALFSQRARCFLLNMWTDYRPSSSSLQESSFARDQHDITVYDDDHC